MKYVHTFLNFYSLSLSVLFSKIKNVNLHLHLFPASLITLASFKYD